MLMKSVQLSVSLCVSRMFIIYELIREFQILWQQWQELSLYLEYSQSETVRGPGQEVTSLESQHENKDSKFG